MKLIATRELKYNTRRLLAGDVFDTKSDRDAKVLIAIKKAKRHRDESALPAPDPDLIQKGVDATKSQVQQPDPAKDELNALRAEYQAKLGKNPFNGWDAETLRQKIDAAAQS